LKLWSFERTFLESHGQQPTQLLMPTQKIIELKKATAQKFYANAQNTLSFFCSHTKAPRKKMKECFRQRFKTQIQTVSLNFN
jgi:hypothetical protein